MTRSARLAAGAHAAGADGGDDFIGTEALAGGERHGSDGWIISAHRERPGTIARQRPYFTVQPHGTLTGAVTDFPAKASVRPE